MIDYCLKIHIIKTSFHFPGLFSERKLPCTSNSTFATAATSFATVSTVCKRWLPFSMSTPLRWLRSSICFEPLRCLAAPGRLGRISIASSTKAPNRINPRNPIMRTPFDVVGMDNAVQGMLTVFGCFLFFHLLLEMVLMAYCTIRAAVRFVTRGLIALSNLVHSKL